VQRPASSRTLAEPKPDGSSRTVDSKPMSDAAAQPSWVERTITAIGPPLVLGALGYYFGWERTQALYGYFGLDASLLGFSTQDFVLRSIEAIYGPLTALALAVILAEFLHLVVVPRLMPQSSRRVAYVLIGLAVCALLIGIGGMNDLDKNNIVLSDLGLGAPLMLCAASALGGYGGFLLARRAHRGRRYGLPPLLLGSIVAVGLLGLFWLTSNYARDEGKMRAQELASGMRQMPEVIVFSRNNLGLDSAGASTTVSASDTTGSYRYRYGHLRLLIESGGRFFLLPDSWAYGSGTAIVVADSSDVHIELNEH
jgi:hypothetical protein